MKSFGEVIRLAKYKSKNPTQAEAIAFTILAGNGIVDKYFLFQNIFGFFILDFVIPSRMLAIEVCGEYHYSNKNTIENDNRKKSFCQKYGLKLISIENNKVEQILPIVIKKFKVVDNWKQKWIEAQLKSLKFANSKRINGIQGVSDPLIGFYFKNLYKEFRMLNIDETGESFIEADELNKKHIKQIIN